MRGAAGRVAVASWEVAEDYWVQPLAVAVRVRVAEDFGVRVVAVRAWEA